MVIAPPSAAPAAVAVVAPATAGALPASAGAASALPAPAPDIPVRNDRYPGTSGRQQGDRNVTAPAAAATGIASSSGPDATRLVTLIRAARHRSLTCHQYDRLRNGPAAALLVSRYRYRVNSVAVTAGKAPGTRLARAGAIAFLIVVASWVIYAVISGRDGALDPVDLTVYRDGGLIVRHVQPYYDPHAAAPLYDWGGFSSLALKFTYTPFAAIAFAFISFIGWTPLWVLSIIVNIASLLAALWFTFGGLGYRDRRVRLGATLVAAAVTFWLQPVVRTIYLGQINLLLMAAIIWDMCQPREGRWWKGAVTGVAAGIKLVPLIFVPYLLVTRKFREAAMTVAGFGVTVLIGFVILPSDSAKWWLHGMVISDGNRTGFTGWAGNQSLRAITTRLSGSITAGTAPWIVAAALAFVLGMTAAALLERGGYHVPALLATALTGLLISPISWDHHWVWIAPGVAVAGHYAIAQRRAARSAAQRWRARWLGALAIFMIFVYGAWPDAIWEKARNLGRFSLGFLWAQKNTNPILFSRYGDLPQWVEYHWHGFQLLWGNAYILGGMALLLILLALAVRLRGATPVTSEPETSSLTSPVPGRGAGMRHPGGVALVLAGLFGLVILAGPNARAASSPAPVPPAPNQIAATATSLTQQSDGTWTTTVFVDTGALCPDAVSFDLLTTKPYSDTPPPFRSTPTASAAPLPPRARIRSQK